MDSAEVGHQRAATKCKLVHVGFPNQNGAGRLKLAYNLGVGFRYTVPKKSTAGSGPDASRIEKILHGNRNTVQWSSPLLLKNFRFRLLSGLYRNVARDGDVRI